ncbi:MAG: GHMP kinase, partial [Planctomycetes bacterium]|nr:GHMP kinase [Planctomycetota bacterium]
DRVIQVYEGLIYMDFAAEASHEVCGLTCSRYEPLEVSLLPPLYLAYRTGASEPTEIVHSDLRARYQQGDAALHAAMRKFAELTEQARTAILDGDGPRLGELIDANYDLRRSICRIAPWQAEMVEQARAAGATAKFAGSGGAIIGTYADEAGYRHLQEKLAEIGCLVIKPG